MRVIIAGGTGLIGRPLAAALARRGHEVVVLSRDPALAARAFERRGLASIRTVGWDGRTAQGWGELIVGESAIVNLAGASPAHWRWTNAYRARILESRLHAGEAVMQAIARYGPPDVLVQASASGYYGDRGQIVLTEASLPGRGFRAEVCQAWEASTARAATRRCVLRTGIALDTSAGAFPPLLRFARLLGSQLATGSSGYPGFTMRTSLMRSSSCSSTAPSPARSISACRCRRRIRKSCRRCDGRFGDPPFSRYRPGHCAWLWEKCRASCWTASACRRNACWRLAFSSTIPSSIERCATCCPRSARMPSAQRDGSTPYTRFARG